MPDAFQYDVFLSHNHADKPRVLLLCISPAALASGWVALERSTAVHRDPSNGGRRFIPLLLVDCNLPDTLRRYKYVDFREESEAAFADVLGAAQAEAGAMKRRFGPLPGGREASLRRRARQSNATLPPTPPTSSKPSSKKPSPWHQPTTEP